MKVIIFRTVFVETVLERFNFIFIQYSSATTKTILQKDHKVESTQFQPKVDIITSDGGRMYCRTVIIRLH